ncbi:MAG: aminotransferase class I/II-fold pyridoxal phosphate-dependent enzyme, partial [Acidimicrobiales bacterium]
LIEACNRVTLPYHLDAFKQAAGIAALGYEMEMRERVSRLVEQRGRIERGLAELGAETWHSDANFVLFRAPGREAKEIWEGLLRHSVLIRDVSGFSGLEGCMRVSVGTEYECGRFLQGLAEVLSS